MCDNIYFQCWFKTTYGFDGSSLSKISERLPPKYLECCSKVFKHTNRSSQDCKRDNVNCRTFHVKHVLTSCESWEQNYEIIKSPKTTLSGMVVYFHPLKSVSTSIPWINIYNLAFPKYDRCHRTFPIPQHSTRIPDINIQYPRKKVLP